MKFQRRPAMLILALTVLALAVPALAASPAPRLILQITVDQLRGDLPGRYRDRLGEGGFRYLLENGTWYANAHYQHANTETAVGHATLATGADPSRHGMGNLNVHETSSLDMSDLRGFPYARLG